MSGTAAPTTHHSCTASATQKRRAIRSDYANPRVGARTQEPPASTVGTGGQ